MYGDALAQEPSTGDHDILNLDRPGLGHHYYKPSLSDPIHARE